MGANVGVYSMWALYNNVKQVYAFEPTPNNVSCLIKTFNKYPNIQIFDKAISDKNETCQFFTFPYSVCNSLCYTEGFNIKKYGLLGDDSEKIGGIEQKPVEIEVIKEIRVEVPVEVVKYVEVPVEVGNLSLLITILL